MTEFQCRNISGYYPVAKKDQATRYLDITKGSTTLLDLIHHYDTEVVELLIKNGSYSENDLSAILKLLSTEKVAQFIGLMNDLGLQQRLFSKIFSSNPNKALNIIFAYKKPDFNLSEFYNPFSSNEFMAALLIAGLPKEKAKTILNNIKTIDPTYYQAINLQTEKFNAYQTTCFNQRINFTLLPSESMPQKPLVIVKQCQYKIMNASENSLLATKLGPCIALVLHDTKTGTTTMVHFDPTADRVDTIFDKIKNDLSKLGVDIGNMKAHIIGGWINYSENSLFNIQYRLQKEGIEVINYDVLNPQQSTRCFSFDPQNNSLYNLAHNIFYKNLK